MVVVVKTMQYKLIVVHTVISLNEMNVNAAGNRIQFKLMDLQVPGQFT